MGVVSVKVGNPDCRHRFLIMRTRVSTKKTTALHRCKHCGAEKSTLTWRRKWRSETG